MQAQEPKMKEEIKIKKQTFLSNILNKVTNFYILSEFMILSYSDWSQCWIVLTFALSSMSELKYPARIIDFALFKFDIYVLTIIMTMKWCP